MLKTVWTLESVEPSAFINALVNCGAPLSTRIRPSIVVSTTTFVPKSVTTDAMERKSGRHSPMRGEAQNDCHSTQSAFQKLSAIHRHQLAPCLL